MVMPRLSEEAALMCREEVAMRGRRAAIVAAAQGEAVDMQCIRLLHLIDVRGPGGREGVAGGLDFRWEGFLQLIDVREGARRGGAGRLGVCLCLSVCVCLCAHARGGGSGV